MKKATHLSRSEKRLTASSSSCSRQKSRHQSPTCPGSSRPVCSLGTMRHTYAGTHVGQGRPQEECDRKEGEIILTDFLRLDLKSLAGRAGQPPYNPPREGAKKGGKRRAPFKLPAQSVGAGLHSFQPPKNLHQSLSHPHGRRRRTSNDRPQVLIRRRQVPLHVTNDLILAASLRATSSSENTV